MLGDGSFTKTLRQSRNTIVKQSALMTVSAGYLAVRHNYKKAQRMEKRVLEEQEPPTEQDTSVDYYFTEEGVHLILKSVELVLGSTIVLSEEEYDEFSSLRELSEWMLSPEFKESL